MLEGNPKQLFSYVFSKLIFSKEIKDIFEYAIVENIIIHKESSQMTVYLRVFEDCTKWIPVLEKQIHAHFCSLAKVTVVINIMNPEALIDQDISDQNIQTFWKQLLQNMGQQAPFLTTVLSYASCKLKEHTVCVFLPDIYQSYIDKTSCNTFIKTAFKACFPRLSVTFQYQEKQDNVFSLREEVKQITDTTIHTMVVSTAKQTPVKQIIQPKEPTDILLGKEFNDRITLLKDLPENDEVISVQVYVMSMEVRELKNQNMLITMDITDYTYSITCKFFIKQDKWEMIAGDLKKGIWVQIRGLLEYDTFIQERILKAKDIVKVEVDEKIRMDTSEEKRVELHAHTQMSTMDATVPVSKLIERASLWGHKAIAITDHGVVQAFPDAAIAAKKYNMKVLYGVEAYIVDDQDSIIQNGKGQTLEDEYVVFDIETTGFIPGRNKITEIGALKIKNGEIVDRYEAFVNPNELLTQEIIELTGITDDMLKDAPTIDKVLPEFLTFVGDSVLVAHNASFDTGFISYYARELGYVVENTILDTLGLARLLLPQLTRHKLNFITKYLKIELTQHHRAIHDAEATALVLLHFFGQLKQLKVEDLTALNEYAAGKIDVKKLKTYHAIILVKNQVGLVNLYRLITKSHMNYFFKRPRIPKSVYSAYKEGLIIGSACEAGELYHAILEKKTDKQILEIANFYDYLEIQPLGNNVFLLDKGKVGSMEELKNINRDIVNLGKKLGKKVVATGDIHFLDPEDEVYRRIIMTGQGFTDADRQPPLYFHTTDEFLKEFSYLGEEAAYEVVIKNPNLLADSIETIKPIPDETFPPKIDGADDELVQITMDKAVEIYGSPLPEPVQSRLDRELGSIIKNGFAVLYIIAQKLVWKSLEDGYLVGSRGSVGSSFVATMASITEVNPLSPHYICPNCKYSEFDSEDVLKFAGGSGCDMPDKVCPKCKTPLIKEGHDIPFETFLGFDGDKEPDIDLNFSGEYQPRAHSYTEELFGSSHVFRAGTIGTLAEKTAYGFVQKYLEEKDTQLTKAETNRLIRGCTGIKRTTGQHPGGLMVVPRDNDIHNFCPVQRPANDMKSTTTTTHFDYHSISGRLLKLDILGHDDPTVIRMLEDITGLNAQEIPIDDKKTMSLFTSTEALGVTKEMIHSEVGTLGLPEFGTKFVRQMLVDTQPKTFSALIRISGLSHGTDVWLNNAQELVRQKVVDISQVISTRDDIMVYLIIQGVEKKSAFKIMECVRKGKGLTDEQEEAMREAGVEEWYIDSCKKIKYMFPKAHAAAYVMMAFRIAYFKVYYPVAFYATYFSIRAKGNFDYELMCKGEVNCQYAIKELEGKPFLSTKEKDTLTVLELVREMYVRGIGFKPIDLYHSQADRFIVCEDGILPPFNALQGLGDTAAKNIVEARKKGEFLSIEQFRLETKVSQTIIELMKINGIFGDLPDTSQLSLF